MFFFSSFFSFWALWFDGGGLGRVAVLVVGMEVSRRSWVRFLSSLGYETRSSELAIDRLCAVRELGLWPCGSAAIWGSRRMWRRTLSAGLSEHYLRTIVIFALIHVRSCRSHLSRSGAGGDGVRLGG